jgi:hypothetical protein
MRIERFISRLRKLRSYQWFDGHMSKMADAAAIVGLLVTLYTALR